MNRQAGDPSEVSGPISLRPMTVQDIPFGLKLSSLAGWNQTEADWAILLEQSTVGSFLACYNRVEAGTVTTATYQKHLNLSPDLLSQAMAAVQTLDEWVRIVLSNENVTERVCSFPVVLVMNELVRRVRLC
jgi:hypothetical protein